MTSSLRTMFDNLATACHHMLEGPYGGIVAPKEGLTVFYGEPPCEIDLVIIHCQSGTDRPPLYDPTGRPWPDRLIHADEALDPSATGNRLRRLFAAHGLADVLRERTAAMNAIFPNASSRDTRLWLYGGGSHGAWRQFSTVWAELLLDEMQPLAILLLGREARLALGRRLPPLGVVEVPDFADPGAQDDSLYDTPFALLRRLLGRGA